MKFPKNRANVYVIVRSDRSNVFDAIVGVFANYDDAEDFAGACQQEWLEKTKQKLKFEVKLSTFYG